MLYFPFQNLMIDGQRITQRLRIFDSIFGIYKQADITKSPPDFRRAFACNHSNAIAREAYDETKK